MLKNKCVAILTKSGKVGWTWRSSFTHYTPEMRQDIAATALFFANDDQPDAEVQKLAEQALAQQVERWAVNQTPSDED